MILIRDKKIFDIEKFSEHIFFREELLNSLSGSNSYSTSIELLIMKFVCNESFEKLVTFLDQSLSFGNLYKKNQEKYPNHEYFHQEIWVILAFSYGLNISQPLWNKLCKLLAPPGSEWLVDTLISQKKTNWEIGDLEQWRESPTGKRFNWLYDFMQTSDSQFALKHLKKWHSNANKAHFRRMVGYGALATDPNVKYEYYIGQFSFELAAVVMAFDIDDSEFREDIYYPKELVDHWRKNK